jgi:hypothetical protein
MASITQDLKSREFWFALVAAVLAFLVTFHLPRILHRNL